MGRVFLWLSLCLLLPGCTNAFSRSVIVRSPAAVSDVQPGTDAGSGGRLMPGSVSSARGWGPAASSSAAPSSRTSSSATRSSATPSSGSSATAAAPPGFAVARSTATVPDPGRLSQRPGPSRTWTQYGQPTTLSEAEAAAYRRRCCLYQGRRKSNLLTVGVLGGMVAYGFAFFDYGSSKYQIKDDGWFEKDNKDGGSDKWGHALSAHIQTAVFSSINRAWGIPRKEAALRGAITAFSTQFVMELGDGFSEEFGSSWTDIVANTAGCVFGYFHETSPRFNELFDFRWEYWPSDQVTKEGEYELSTDIEGSSYVLALNLGALYSRRSNFLDYFDFQAGYASRHYKDKKAPTERRPFIGVGINLTNVCKRFRLPVLAKLFEYYQPPGISLRLDTNLND